jgi:allantoinase
MFDIAIAGNHICTADGIRKGVVIIRDGVIADILDDYPEGRSYDAVYIGDKVLMPGIIDPNVHINEPGRTQWEGFVTATMAAVGGGITTLVDMPLYSDPVTTTVDAFEQKLAAAIMLQVDCGFWGGLVPGNLSEIELLIDKGVMGFKAFLSHSGIEQFPSVTEDDLRKAMPIIAKYGLPLLVHCEMDGNQTTTINNPGSYQQFLQSRPAAWEDAGIAMMIRLCEEYNCRVHILHLSSASSIAPIQQAKEKGLPLTVETAQHYLYFNAEDLPDAQPAFKCTPPIREKENNDQLWQALQDGIIDFVATDHSPTPPDLKQIESGNLAKAWSGIASLQFALPALWTAARRRKIPWWRLAGWLCEKPADLCGLTKKGKIARGYVADLVIWDPEKSFRVMPENILHKHKITPYLHEELFGVVEQTWLGGEQLYDYGEFLELNKGKQLFVDRAQSANQ